MIYFIIIIIFACISSAGHINGIIHIIHESEGVTWQDDLLYITGKLIMTLSLSLSVTGTRSNELIVSF